MKVLIIAPTVVPLGTGHYGGIELLVSHHLQGLVDAGDSVTVAAPYGSIVPSGVKLIETVRLPEEQDREDLAIDAIAHDVVEHAGLQSIGYEVIHDFSHKHLIGQRGRKIPAVYMMWDPIYFKYPKSTYNIICLSQWQVDRFELLYNQKARLGLTGWIDTKLFKPNDNHRSDRYLFLGKLSQEKGADLALLYAKKLNVPLDIVGGLIPSEYDSGLRKFLEQECRGDIQLHFNVTEEEKLRYLLNCKALIYPVVQDEAHWLAGIEAWCTDTPTIVMNRGAMSSIMPKQFVADNEEDFKRKMLNVEVNEQVIEWGKQSRAYYNIEACVKQYRWLYEQVIAGARW